MIDEAIEVQHILDGKFSKQNLYNIYYLLAKYYIEQGLEPSEVRSAIFKWANLHDLFVKYDLNALIRKAREDKHKLKRDIRVCISQSDIDNINNGFDNKNTKLVALAILCYAKVNSNKDKEFTISSCDIGAWVNIHHSSVRRRYIDELVEFGYLSKIKTPVNNYKWKNSKDEVSTRYKINVNFDNSGEFELINNDIHKLYNQIFITTMNN